MRWLAVLAVLISPAVASGQDYSFGDWARDQGYLPGDVMPSEVDALDSSIDSLDGIGEFDWITTPTRDLFLGSNQLSSIESGAFSGLSSLGWLDLHDNQLSSIESGAFSELTNLQFLELAYNQISSIEPGDFSELTNLRELDLCCNQISSIESGDFGDSANRWTLYMQSNQISSIEPGDFSGLTNLTSLELYDNQISSIEAGDFNELANLERLSLNGNQLSSIESGAFRGLTSLKWLDLHDNTALTELNLAEADLPSLARFDLDGNVNIISASLRNATVSQRSLATLLYGGALWLTGIGELGGITEMDLSGIDFADITDLEPLYAMDDLTDLWLVNTQNVDATELDVLLDNLETIEGTDTEGVLYMTEADFDAFNAAGSDLLSNWNDESGHHVEFLQIGDVNHDTDVNGLDVDPFVRLLVRSQFDVAADCNDDMAVNGLDVRCFIQTLISVGTQPVPEPSTLLLTLIALGVVGGWRKTDGRP